MIVTLLGMFLGTVAGGLLAGIPGAILGVVAGLALGLMYAGVRPNVRSIPPGVEVIRDEEPILCVPKGQVAEVTFVRDAQCRHWYDVERCSLCSPENDVQCAKNCLALIRNSADRCQPQTS